MGLEEGGLLIDRFMVYRCRQLLPYITWLERASVRFDKDGTRYLVPVLICTYGLMVGLLGFLPFTWARIRNLEIIEEETDTYSWSEDSINFDWKKEGF